MPHPSLTHLNISNTSTSLLTIHNLTNRARTSSTSNLHLKLLIRIRNRAVITLVLLTLMTKAIHTIDRKCSSVAIESGLAMLYAALAIGFSGSGGGFLLFYFFVGDGAGDNVGEKFEVVEVRYGICWKWLVNV
jgi:hypothetical protein